MVVAGLLLLGFAGVWQLQRKIDAQQAALHQEQDELVLRSAKLIKVMSLEYRAVTGGCVLDARGAVLRRQTHARQARLGAALAAAGHSDHARSQSASSVPVWLDVPR